MTRDADSVLEEALALPEAERALIAAGLLASINDPAEEYTVEAADGFARELEVRCGFAQEDVPS